MTHTTLLEAIGIGRRASSRWLLKDVSVDIRPGMRIGICGTSGSGKTLLLRALAQLDPIDEGQLRWHGHAVASTAVPAFRSQVMYLHQRPALVEGTVEDNLKLPFTLRQHQHREYSRDDVRGMLDQVDRGLSLLDQSTRELSGGEAQIVAILRAIQLAPTVMLLDEPTASLDEQSTRAIERLVSGWFHASGDRSLVWVSHNRAQVARIADRVGSMQDGRLITDAMRHQEIR